MRDSVHHPFRAHPNTLIPPLGSCVAMSRYSSSLSRPAGANSRPNSGYEDLSLDEEDSSTSALGPVEDPWAKKGDKTSRHFSPSYELPSHPLAPGVDEEEGYTVPGPSRPNNIRSPPSTSAASVLSMSTSIASSSKSKGGFVEVSERSDGPVVLGVAVVDFNHLVRALVGGCGRGLMGRLARRSNGHIRRI